MPLIPALVSKCDATHISLTQAKDITNWRSGGTRKD